MILRPTAGSRSIWQALARSSSNTSRVLQHQQRRNNATVPHLGVNNTKGAFFEENGVPGFLTSRTYQQTWLAYQQHLCDEVNSTLEGSKEESLKPYELHVRHSHEPERASLYNAAAMLHFNHFFWEGIATEKKPIPGQLETMIEDQFGSVEELRVEMLQHADAMFGNGFVWLMKEGLSQAGGAIGTGSRVTSRLRILCTYNAGSPHPDAHKRKQAQDMATADPKQYASRLTTPQNTVGAFGATSGSSASQTYPNSLSANPILCINNWQHMYMLDYGILGKQSYLSAWWERIDWDVVQSRYNMEVSPAQAMSPLLRFGKRR